MNVVDSSGWLEYFADDTNADYFTEPIENVAELLVPTISLYEVFKRVLQQRDENDALEAVAQMMRGQLIELNSSIALSAAKLAIQYKMPMADSIMLATAYEHGATLWTQDAHFASVPSVRYIPKISL
jgi:toxin FitB